MTTSVTKFIRRHPLKSHSSSTHKGYNNTATAFHFPQARVDHRKYNMKWKLWKGGCGKGKLQRMCLWERISACHGKTMRLNATYSVAERTSTMYNCQHINKQEYQQVCTVKFFVLDEICKSTATERRYVLGRCPFSAEAYVSVSGPSVLRFVCSTRRQVSLCRLSIVLRDSHRQSSSAFLSEHLFTHALGACFSLRHGLLRGLRLRLYLSVFIWVRRTGDFLLIDVQ
ncbi:hypothetical protein C8R41DRAFT_400201 [Lentinula lateritia]|uniref:Uncharacterized protein n=1 Tax=Lentinula lateritia TaxID=40482 RepID=A0ABQ8VGC2_9AGAR|nr:hypothetical protein C8R41DRAFT_400201 [Lentinula lateritia]